MLKKLKQFEKSSIERGIPIIGPVKGKWLYDQIKKYRPKTILELGTANGYSGCILGSQGGHLTTIDIDKKIQEEALINFDKHKINSTILTGDAVAVTKELSEKYSEIFDLIFIDFAKNKYIDVLEPSLILVRKGGCIIADNISFEGCKDFKDAVLAHDKLNTKIADIEDGLSISTKI